MAMERARWSETRLRAEIWWCGDEECDCTQPVIERVQPNYEAGYPWIRTVREWEGTFRSQATAEEYREQRRELYREARRRGMRLRDNTGERVVVHSTFAAPSL